MSENEVVKKSRSAGRPKGRSSGNNSSTNSGERVYRTQFRYLDAKHYDLVQRAAKRAGLSANAWIIRATMKALGKKV